MNSSSKARKLPSKKAILQHWADNGMFDPPENVELCWGCILQYGTQRCHIVARCDGGSDDVENLVLLCIHCHQIQETLCKTPEGAERFKSHIMDGATFLSAGMARKTEMFRCKYGFDIDDLASLKVPFGFKLSFDGRTLEVNDAEQHTLDLIRQLLDEGETLDDIMRELRKARSA